MRNAIRLFRKDLLLELRHPYAVYGVLLYVVSTVFVLYLTMERPEAETWNGLFWVMLLFVCVNAVAKGFLQESRGRMLYYHTLSGPTSFVMSKTLYNVVLMAAMTLVTLLLFVAFLGKPTYDLMAFAGVGMLGGLGLSLTFTMLAAIASKAMQQASLMAILGFPVILPQLLLSMRLSKAAFAEAFQEGAVSQLVLLLLALDCGILVLTLILYPYLWKD
jgi:heme exporter protein B